jgi:hypothetical protein
MAKYIKPDEIEEFNIKDHNFLDKTILIVGPKGVGKTTLILDLLYWLGRRKVSVARIISKSKDANRDYADHVHPLFISSDFKPEYISSFYNRLMEIENRKDLGIIKRKQYGEKLMPSKTKHYYKQIRQKIHELKIKITELNDLREDQVRITRSDQREYIENELFRGKKDLKTAIMILDQILNKVIKDNIQHIPRDDLSHIFFIYQNWKSILVIDDCMENLKSTRKIKALEDMCANGRHFNLSLVIATQYPIIMERSQRSNIDYAFIFIDYENLEKSWEAYGKCMTKKDFGHAMNKYAKSVGHCLVIQRTGDGTQRNSVYRYSARQRLSFKVGSHEYNEFAQQNYDESAYLTRALETRKK